MAKKRVHEIAKQVGLESKEVLAALKDAGIEVKTASSSVEEAAAMAALKPAAKAAPAEPAKPTKAAAPAPKKQAAKKEAPKKAAPKEEAPSAKTEPEPAAEPSEPAAPAQPVKRRPTPNHPQAIPADDEPAEPQEMMSKPVPDRKASKGKAAAKGAAEPQTRPVPSRSDAAPAESDASKKRRRVVIDSQASRRDQGGPPPPQRPPRRRGRRRRPVFEEPEEKVETEPEKPAAIKVNSGATVREVAETLDVSSAELIKSLMQAGEMATLTQTLPDETIEVLASNFDREVEIIHTDEEVVDVPVYEDSDDELVNRPPVVTIMGHVDHGKTSLLDAIRQTTVAEGEAGGITQHIGAYQVTHDGKTISFLDTPGHEAFTAMRARGAQVTDVAVIVVAADDGVMPQTMEAIDHAKAADVAIMVAVNKIDKEGAAPERIRTELAGHGLNPEEWGGDTVYCDVSAKTGDGLDNLLHMIQLISELEELEANPDADASGTVIESHLDQGRGAVVSLLVQRGTLRVGDSLVAGPHWGRVKAMHDHTGQRVTEAKPGDPVEVLGFEGVCEAGELVVTADNDRRARQLAGERANRLKTEALARRQARKFSLEEVFEKAKKGQLKQLALVLKADVSGSLEALQDEIAKLPQDQIAVDVIHAAPGGINESDVMLAAASEAIIIGFNVRPVGDAKRAAQREGVEIRTYSIIYKITEELRNAMEGMLEPEKVEEAIGEIEILELFKASKIGTIAGSIVKSGRASREAEARLVRDGTVIWTGKVGSLRRFKDDVKEVTEGQECGLTLDGYADVKVGDIVEMFSTKEVEQTLNG